MRRGAVDRPAASSPTFGSAALAALALCVLANACHAPSNPCGPLVVWERAATTTATVVGSWDHFARPGRTDWERVAAPDGSTWLRLAVSLPPGVYQYALYDGVALYPDARNPRSAYLADPFVADPAPFSVEVSEADLASCATPVIAMSAITGDDHSVRFGAVLGDAEAAPTVSLSRGADSLDAPAWSRDGHTLQAIAADLVPGKYTLHIGADGTDLVASAFVEERPGRQLGDGLVYQIMIDRFRGDGPLAAPATPGDRAGGTLDGVTQTIQAGYFDRLGVTTLWLSPVYQNPSGRFRGRDGHPYEAYHGYWPSEPRTVEPAFGGEAALDRLIASAHARGLRVILDVVPNHVHEQHPYYQQHSRQAGNYSWFHDGPDACVCGAPGCDWSTRIEDCWFDTYLPDLQLRDPQVITALTDDLLFWQSRFDLDGFRIDAVPMMPRPALRDMARAVRAARQRKGLDALLLGETFTGPGAAGREQIAAYLGLDVDGLDSEFDFPLLWATRDVIAHGIRGLDELQAEIAASDAAWRGSGATVGHFIGNHDTTRFVSESSGDAGGDPWTAPPPQPTAAEPYQRQLLALTLMLTLPGLPVLYYGDEVALAGATDPDSRRVLPDVLGTLPPAQAGLLAQVSRLGRLRRCSDALRRGERRPLLADPEHLVALHTGDDPVVVVLSRAGGTSIVAGVPAGSYRDVLGGSPLSVDGSGAATITLPALSAAVYLLESSSCQE
jgi:glycosidase